MLDIVDETVSSCFWTNEASSPGEAFASKHTSKLVPELLVGTEEVTNFTATCTNVAS